MDNRVTFNEISTQPTSIVKQEKTELPFQYASFLCLLQGGVADLQKDLGSLRNLWMKYTWYL